MMLSRALQEYHRQVIEGISYICDGVGRPLWLHLTAGNVNDTIGLERLLDGVHVARPGPERPRSSPTGDGVAARRAASRLRSGGQQGEQRRGMLLHPVKSIGAILPPATTRPRPTTPARSPWPRCSCRPPEDAIRQTRPRPSCSRRDRTPRAGVRQRGHLHRVDHLHGRRLRTFRRP